MKNQKKNLFYSNRFVILAFFCSAILTCIIYAIHNIYPFGDQTILRVDLFHQYAPFLEELRNRILNGQSLSYSWEGGLGKDFVAQMAYYTASPISFLILLFPQKALPEALAFFILIKISFSASTFSYYIKKHFQRNDFSILIFGLLYSFCAFVTCYYWNVMWLDTVALFPLVALGTEKLIHENKHIFYYSVLTLTIIVNFYMAVLVCIFTAFYFLAVLLSHYHLRQDYRVMLMRMVKFGFVSILSAMTAMFILAPVAQALSNTATSNTAFPEFSIYTNVYQLFTGHFLGARPAVLARNEDLPNIYSGILTLMLLPFYFFNKKNNKREKWYLSAMLVLMLLCSCIKPLDYIIHGFHFPSNLPHRYTFIYSFILLYMAYSGFIHIRDCHFRFVVFAALFYVAVILISEFLIVPSIPEIDRVLSNQDILLNFTAFVVYFCLLYYLYKHPIKNMKGLLGVLFLCVCAECLYSGAENLEETSDRQEYTAYMDSTEKAIDYLNEREDGQFYRTEFRRFTTINDASLYHYNGFSQFSSLAPGGISNFIANLGIAATGNSFRYYDPTPLIDAIFDIKYVMNKKEPMAKNKYTLLENFNNIWVYENEQVLPLGFIVNQEISEWKVSNSQPFDVQNDFIHKATGIQENLFTLMEADHIICMNMNTTKINNADNCFNYTLNDPSNLSLIPSVTATYTSPEDQYLYLYVDATNAQRFVYHTKTENQDRELSAGKSLIDVGYVSAGETVTVEFSLTKRGLFEKSYRENGTVKLYAASYNDSIFQNAYRILNDHIYNITSFSDTDIEGIVSTDTDGVLFTSIPFIDGWNVTIDGERTDKLSIGENGVIGVKITAGNHIVKFSYRQQVLPKALLISIIGLLLFFLYTYFDKIYQQKNPIIQKSQV